MKNHYSFAFAFIFCISFIQAQTYTYNYTGQIDTFVVPACVTSLRITVRGAQGGFNSSSTIPAGLGASVTGDFTVTPGDSILILVGEQPASIDGNGGGGGSFVVSANGVPMIIAGGGGGSSQTTDSPDKHGNITTVGGTGAAGGGIGGTAGNGGSIGASGFQSGAGGGFYTNGADGWTTNTGGLSFLNGGSGGTANANARGGFGGGGSGSSYVVGGGGGGYSGGGSGGNSTAGVGGGGASYNAGTNTADTTGVNYGHGLVLIEVISSGSGAVLVMDSILHTVTCHDDSDAVVELTATGGSGIYTYNFNGGGFMTDSVYTGLSTGTYWYQAMDGCTNVTDTMYVSIANADSIYAGIVVTPETNGNDGTVTVNGMGGTGSLSYTLDSGAPQTSGVFTGLAGGSYTITITDSAGCSRAYTVTVLSTVSVNENGGSLVKVYPNPVADVLNVQLGEIKDAVVTVTDMKGALVYQQMSFGEQQFSINMSDMHSGIYLVKIMSGEVLLFQDKIVK